MKTVPRFCSATTFTPMARLPSSRLPRDSGASSREGDTQTSKEVGHRPPTHFSWEKEEGGFEESCEFNVFFVRSISFVRQEI
jgi:hypothetical protein